MRREFTRNMIILTESIIQTEALLEEVSVPEAGAVLLFLGTTRNVTAGRETASLDYTCYREMAIKKLSELQEEAGQKWPILKSAIVHRLGHLEIGEASVAVAVSAAHRDAAFEAGRWLIDTLKQAVPIWKQEHWGDGTNTWVHPGLILGDKISSDKQGRPCGDLG
jgi:molybdopterin synthase catalytic subunit